MKAVIVIVLRDFGLMTAVAAALKDHGHQVAAFTDPMSALNAIYSATPIDLLITSVSFEPKTPHGVALARIGITQRRVANVLFVALPQYQDEAAGIGKFLAMPVAAHEVVAEVDRMFPTRVE